MHLLLLGVHAVLAHLVQREQRAERPLRELLSSPVDALQVRVPPAIARTPRTALAPRAPAARMAAETLDVPDFLRERISAALRAAYGPEVADTDPLLTPATKPEFGDFQCNVAMSLAKRLKAKPRDVANTLVENLDVGTVFAAPEVAGPGFINLRLTPAFLQEQLAAMLADESRSAVPEAAAAQRVVVDYSSPNIAKEMHVGHLRSTIIGDCLSRVLEFRGHDVLRLNHVGDWGTQFGMLIAHMEDFPERTAQSVADLVDLYREARQRFEADAVFQDRARGEVVRLQAGEADSLAAWRRLCEQSEVAFREVYELLAIDARLETRGESFYNAQLPDVIHQLECVGMLEESNGAQCVFLDGYETRDGERLPVIVQKSDGGYMYATTDLAAVRQRVGAERAQRVLYVTDSGQATHFEQIFAISRAASFAPPEVSLEHVPFGLVLGEDGKKFKTRSGDTVKLRDLLDEAIVRTEKDVRARLEAEGREESEAFVQDVARTVGIGAVKYADLAMNRNSNYRFSFDKMLSLQGNTAPYMLYAYARIRSIQRRATEAGASAALRAEDLVLDTEQELALARHLVRFADVLREVEADLLPHKLCEYIFDLSGKFNQFYEACPVLTAPTEALRASRLALGSLTASVLGRSLGLLGIETLERL